MEKTTAGVNIKVGSIPHPMEKTHYIEWIELINNGKVLRKFLKPGDAPEADFELKVDDIKNLKQGNTVTFMVCGGHKILPPPKQTSFK